MSRRRSSPQRNPSSPRPVISRTVSLAFVAVALVIFLAIQAGGLSTILGVPQVEATAVIAEEGANGNATEPQDTQQADQAAVPTAPNGPGNTGEAAAVVTATAAPRATLAPTPTANAPPVRRAGDLPTIDYADLPPEAHETIALIDVGGPFPFNKDGSTFQNREGILPNRPRGYYREYTVITPGEDDRGARRIVGGDEGELYYTDDHYNSFREIMR